MVVPLVEKMAPESLSQWVVQLVGTTAPKMVVQMEVQFVVSRPSLNRLAICSSTAC